VSAPRRNALFVFAHQDDEYAAAPWIVEELANGNDVACVYLTDGGSRVAPEIRDEESRAALRSLRVAEERVAFLCDERGTRIADGALATRCADGLAMLERWIAQTPFGPMRLYAPSYEGGHPDHDAAHLIAAVVARRCGIVADAWHFALYNAYRCPKPFFTMLRQLPSGAPFRRAATTAASRWKLATLCAHYPSQRRTWLGLFPGAFLERVVAHRESVVRFDLARLARRPHDGELLYERLFGMRYEAFARAVAPLLSVMLD
jgi:LmbE family N-acetylglucosaminyl deacetylase